MFYGGDAIYPAYVGKVVSKYTTNAQDNNDGVPGYNVRFHDTKKWQIYLDIQDWKLDKVPAGQQNYINHPGVCRMAAGPWCEA